MRLVYVVATLRLLNAKFYCRTQIWTIMNMESWSFLDTFGPHRPHVVRRCGPFLHLSHVAWSVYVVQKRINRLRCRLGQTHVVPRNPVLDASRCTRENVIYEGDTHRPISTETMRRRFGPFQITLANCHNGHRTYRAAQRRWHVSRH